MNRILVIVFFFFWSCSQKDILDQRLSIITPETSFNTEDGALSALMGIYDILQSQESVARFEMIGAYCSPDVMYCGEPGGNDSPYQNNYMKFNNTQDDRGTLPYWNKMYEGVYRCNVLLGILENKAHLSDFHEAVRKNIMGEIYFLRGLFEFKLLIVFAGLPQLQKDFNNQLMGLPFFDHVPSPDEYYPERPSLNDSWKRVENDFQKAIPFLPRKSEYPPDQTGRATKGAAQAMLAKTYLFTEQWQKAFNAAEEVINSGEYWLEGGKNHDGKYIVTRTSKDGLVKVDMPAYKWIFQPEGDNNGGDIFSVQYHADHSSNQWVSGQSEGDLRVFECGPRGVIAWNEEQQRFTTVNYLWGLYSPTSFFVKTAYKETGSVDKNGKILDPRFKLSVISEGDSVPYYYTNDSVRAAFPDSVLFDAWYNWPCTGYSMWKYFPDPIFRQQATNVGDYEQDIHYLRYADLLLMAAEAGIHIGQTGKALEYINQVRTRARNSGNTGYPKNLNAVTLQDVYAERRVELAFEGHAFFDLVRTKRIKSELDKATQNYGEVYNPELKLSAKTQFGENFVTGKNEIFPIPEAEILLSGGNLKQNPGY